MRTVGVDVASQAAGTASCTIDWEDGAATIGAVASGLDDAALAACLSGPADKIGLDVPLGWPDAFVRAVSRHHLGEPFGDEQTKALVWRRTDRYVREALGLIPLSVSADRIAYPTMRVARILGAAGATTDRSGAGKVVEVYPAAALRVWGFAHRGYKRDAGRDALRETVARVRESCRWLTADDTVWRDIAHDDHCFDALVAALIARANATGLCAPIPAEDVEAARREGWIAVPKPGSLDALA